MWRTALVAAAVYGYGHPVLEGYRPAFLDRPLQTFHAQINHVAYEGYRVLTTLDETRAGRVLRSYVEYANSQLRSKE